MKNIPLTRTRYTELALAKLAGNLWRYVARDNASEPFDPYKGCVGPQYKTKGEALADLERYAAEYGCVGSLVDPERAPPHDAVTCAQCIADAAIDACTKLGGVKVSLFRSEIDGRICVQVDTEPNEELTDGSPQMRIFLNDATIYDGDINLLTVCKHCGSKHPETCGCAE